MRRRNCHLKRILSIVMLLCIGTITGGSLLAAENELAGIDADIQKPKLNSKLIEKINLSGKTLDELVGKNPRLTGLKEIKARFYKLSDFEWSFEQADEILRFYEDNLKPQNWEVMLRKIGENQAILNLVLQEDGERKGLFILELTEKNLTIVRVIGEFNIAIIGELKSILQTEWKLETLRPLSRRIREKEVRKAQVKTSPSMRRREHGVTVEYETKFIDVLRSRLIELKSELNTKLEILEKKTEVIEKQKIIELKLKINAVKKQLQEELGKIREKSDTEKLKQALFLEARPRRKPPKPQFNIEKLKQDISDGKATSKTYYHLGIAYERKMNYKLALDQYDVILEQYPNVSDYILARALYGKGRCSEQLGMIHQAKESYVEFIEKFGTENRFDPAVEMGLVRLEKYGRTIIADENQDAKSCYGFAENQIYNEGNPEKALENLNTIIKWYPESAYAGSAQFMKGVVYNCFQEPNLQMIELLESAVMNYPSPVTHYYLGRAYHERGMYEKAMEQFQTLVDKYPDSNHWHLAIANFNIAKCLEFLGRKGEAVKKYEHFMEKYEDNEDYDHLYTAAQLALKQLKRGKEQMPFLGVSLREVDDKVVVTRVIQGSPAQKAGIIKEDIIFSVDEEKVHYPKEITAAVLDKEIGDDVTLAIMRNGEKLEISATLRAKSKVLKERTPLIDIIPSQPRGKD